MRSSPATTWDSSRSAPFRVYPSDEPSFDSCKTGEEVVSTAKQVLKELIPWDYEWAREMKLADPLGWLQGGVTPTVREPVGRLPSGRVVMPIGDTAVSLDPIAGQGANHGNKMVRHVVSEVTKRGDQAFDEPWMRQTFERFWNDHGAATVRFNNAFLEPIMPAGITLLVSQYGSTGVGDNHCQKIANAVFDNFVDPRLITDAFFEPAKARALVKRVTGKSWQSVFAGGLVRVAGKQLRQAVGLDPRHPLATELP